MSEPYIGAPRKRRDPQAEQLEDADDLRQAIERRAARRAARDQPSEEE